jgi:hypothetical protein
MIPTLIQSQLQEIYDLELEYQVEDFLITDRGLANTLHANPFNRETEEKLLVLEEQGDLRITLFLADELLSSLDVNNPFDQLNGDNLNGYCTALEGVSHFMYLTWNATHDRPVSQLELELQAEVDKFVSIIQLAREQGNLLDWKALNEFLFSCCRYDPLLHSCELERYQAASEYAANFCARLESRNPGCADDGIPHNELRRFYRKRHLDKLSRCRQVEAISAP